MKRSSFKDKPFFYLKRGNIYHSLNHVRVTFVKIDGFEMLLSKQEDCYFPDCPRVHDKEYLMSIIRSIQTVEERDVINNHHYLMMEKRMVAGVEVEVKVAALYLSMDIPMMKECLLAIGQKKNYVKDGKTVPLRSGEPLRVLSDKEIQTMFYMSDVCFEEATPKSPVIATITGGKSSLVSLVDSKLSMPLLLESREKDEASGKMEKQHIGVDISVDVDKIKKEKEKVRGNLDLSEGIQRLYDPSLEFQVSRVRIEKKDRGTYEDVDLSRQYVQQNSFARYRDILMILLNLGKGRYIFPADGIGVGASACSKLLYESVSGDLSDEMVKMSLQLGTGVLKEDVYETIDRGIKKFGDSAVIVISHVLEFVPDLVNGLLREGRRLVVFESATIYEGMNQLRNVDVTNTIKISSDVYWKGLPFIHSNIVKGPPPSASWLKVAFDGSVLSACEGISMRNIEFLKVMGCCVKVAILDFDFLPIDADGQREIYRQIGVEIVVANSKMLFMRVVVADDIVGNYFDIVTGTELSVPKEIPKDIVVGLQQPTMFSYNDAIVKGNVRRLDIVSAQCCYKMRGILVFRSTDLVLVYRNAMVRYRFNVPDNLNERMLQQFVMSHVVKKIVGTGVDLVDMFPDGKGRIVRIKDDSLYSEATDKWYHVS